jgi:hypothetical protein
MPRYFTEKISKKELADKIWAAWEKNEDYERNARSNNWIKETAKEIGPELVADWRANICYKHLTNQVTNDLNKVQFDIENMDVENDGRIGGFQTRDNGLTYLGISAGGDWESPLFFIIYWDGQKLRGYIPTKGNTWNTDTNMAYGNDYEIDDEGADDRNARKRGWESSEDARYNIEEIIQDIEERIRFKEK